MKKRMLSMALALVMCLSLMPTVALAAVEYIIYESYNTVEEASAAGYSLDAEVQLPHSYKTYELRNLNNDTYSQAVPYVELGNVNYWDGKNKEVVIPVAVTNTGTETLYYYNYEDEVDHTGGIAVDDPKLQSVGPGDTVTIPCYPYPRAGKTVEEYYKYLRFYGDMEGSASYLETVLVIPMVYTATWSSTEELSGGSDDDFSVSVTELDLGASADAASKTFTVTNNHSSEPLLVKVNSATHFQASYDLDTRVRGGGYFLLMPGETRDVTVSFDVSDVVPVNRSSTHTGTLKLEAYKTRIIEGYYWKAAYMEKTPIYTAQVDCTFTILWAYNNDVNDPRCRVNGSAKIGNNYVDGGFSFQGEGDVGNDGTTFFAIPGSDVTVTITPDEGYYVEDVKIGYGQYDNGKWVDNNAVSVGAVTSYTFTDLMQNVSITAYFAKGENPNPTPVVEQPSSWAVSFVDQAKAAGIVPEALQSKYTQSITRAEYCALATALYESMKGEITERKTFTDTTDVNVEKMAAIGVVSGVGDNKFSPDSKLTREQAATMLSRLAEALGKPFAETAPTFADNDTISDWAFAAVGKVQANGIMNGVGNNNFSPLTDYTREQSIITMVRMMEHAK